MVEPTEVLEFRGVDKAFGRLKALTSFDLKLAAGAFVAIIGPSGSGKSAIMNLATGLDRPDRGTVRLMGQDIARSPASARAALGAVLGDSALELERSIRTNLRYAGSLYGLRAASAEGRIEALLKRFDLTGHERDRVRSLGALARRRVEIARAALHRPRLLLLNGVSDGLEAPRRGQLRGDVQRLRQDEGIAVLWATHRAEEGADADGIVVLHRGGVSFAGTPADLVAQQGAADFAAAMHKLTGGRTAD